MYIQTQHIKMPRTQRAWGEWHEHNTLSLEHACAQMLLQELQWVNLYSAL